MVGALVDADYVCFTGSTEVERLGSERVRATSIDWRVSTG